MQSLHDSLPHLRILDLYIANEVVFDDVGEELIQRQKITSSVLAYAGDTLLSDSQTHEYFL